MGENLPYRDTVFSCGSKEFDTVKRSFDSGYNIEMKLTNAASFKKGERILFVSPTGQKRTGLILRIHKFKNTHWGKIFVRPVLSAM